jgi:hypothetical protein
MTVICQIKGKVVPVLNELSTTQWRRMGKWRYSSTILDLGTRWRGVVSITPRGKCPRYPFDRRLSGFQSRFRSCEVEKNLLPLPGIEYRPFSPQPVTIPTELSRLTYVPNMNEVVARSPSLYRLSYPGPHMYQIWTQWLPVKLYVRRTYHLLIKFHAVSDG